MRLRSLFRWAVIPPLNSHLSYLAYLGRRQHLLELMRLAERWGWKASGPEMPGHALRIAGEWAGREVHIESGAAHLGAFGCYLSIAVRSEKKLWPMSLAIGMEGAKTSQRKVAAKNKIRNATGRVNTFYVWPSAGHPAEEVDLAALRGALELGREFLQYRMAVNTAAESVWFGKKASFTMSETAEDVEAIIRWLDAIAGVMERHYSDGAGASSANNTNPRE